MIVRFHTMSMVLFCCEHLTKLRKICVMQNIYIYKTDRYD